MWSFLLPAVAAQPSSAIRPTLATLLVPGPPSLGSRHDSCIYLGGCMWAGGEWVLLDTVGRTVWPCHPRDVRGSAGARLGVGAAEGSPRGVSLTKSGHKRGAMYACKRANWESSSPCSPGPRLRRAGNEQGSSGPEEAWGEALSFQTDLVACSHSLPLGA